MLSARLLWLAPLLLAAGCGSRDGDRFVGTGTAIVIPRDPSLEQRTRTADDEEVLASRTSDGRLVLKLDGCELATSPLRDGQGSLPPGASCEGSTTRGTARFRVRRGSVTLFPDGERLSFSFEGEGDGTASGNSEAVRYRYTFSGRRRED